MSDISTYKENNNENKLSNIINKRIKKNRIQKKQVAIINIPVFNKFENKIFFLFGQIIVPIDYKNKFLEDMYISEFISTYKSVDKIIFNKKTNAIERSFSSWSGGVSQLQPIISFLKSQPDFLLYQLAEKLEGYQLLTQLCEQLIVGVRQKLIQNPSMFDLLDQQYMKFEKWAEDFVHQNHKDDFYFYQLYRVNYRKGIYECTKIVKSSNLITLEGYDINEVWNFETSLLRNKFINTSQQIDIEGFLKQMIKRIDNLVNQRDKDKTDYFLFTKEGYRIPSIWQGQFYFYTDHSNDPNFISFDKKDYILIIDTFQVDIYWLQHLLRQRKSFKDFQNKENHKLLLRQELYGKDFKVYQDQYADLADLQLNKEMDLQFLEQERQNDILYQTIKRKFNKISSEQNIANFEYICQAEMFIDKYYPAQSKKGRQNENSKQFDKYQFDYEDQQSDQSTQD